jgi:uncharacterized protein YxeA
MKKIRKTIAIMMCMIITTLSLTACTSNQSYTVQVDGKTFKVTADTSNGESFTFDTSSSSFTLYDKSGAKILSGMYVYKETADEYETVAQDYNIVYGTTSNGFQYFTWNYTTDTSEENNFIVNLTDNISVLIGTTLSASKALQEFGKLTFTVSTN